MRLGNLSSGRKRGASGRVVEWKSENVGAVIFGTIHL